MLFVAFPSTVDWLAREANADESFHKSDNYWEQCPAVCNLEISASHCMLMIASTCFDRYGMAPDVNIIHLPGDFLFLSLKIRNNCQSSVVIVTRHLRLF